MGRKVNMQPKKSDAMVGDLKDATIEQLEALIKELDTTRQSLEEKQVKAQFIVCNDLNVLEDLYIKVHDKILPALEFDVNILTDVYEFGKYINAALTEKRVSITPVEFKRSMRALSMTTFKGIEQANILNDFALLLNNASREIAALDDSYKLNAQLLDKAIAEKELKEMDAQKASEAEHALKADVSTESEAKTED